MLTRSSHNPILAPNPNSVWESSAVFNGSVIKVEDKFVMVYRAMSDEMKHQGHTLCLSTLGRAESLDGESFTNREVFLQPQEGWEQFGCEDPRVTYIDGTYVIFYTALSQFPPDKRSIKIAVALSKDMKTITERHLVTPFNAKAMTMFPEKINGKYTVLFSVDTDNPPAHMVYAQVDSIEQLWDHQFWKEWYAHKDDYILPLRRITTDQIEVGATPIKTYRGWLLIYSYIKNYFYDNKEFRIEAVLLDLKDPTRIIAHVPEPLLRPEEKYEREGIVANIVFPEGALVDGDTLRVYYGGADTTCCVASCSMSGLLDSLDFSPYAIKCTRFDHNPILEPIAQNDWEAQAVFNPAAFAIDTKTYILYRALSPSNVSTIGLAITHDGIYIDERLPTPIYVPRIPEEIALDENSGYGCEDPRVTIIDDTIYMCYTAFNGALPRLAMTQISIQNFFDRKWDTWSLPKLISPPDIADKDGCLLAEKINGKYVFFHRIEPNICIDMVDDLEFVTKPYLEKPYEILPKFEGWDGVKIGINSPPFKTKAGWVVLYHGISPLDHHYRLGAILLDKQDISKVIGRTKYPILEPELPFEKNGVVNNVVFPCGHVLRDDLYIYYGGADTVVCGAKISVDDLVHSMVRV